MQVLKYVLSNFNDLENIIQFGISFCFNWEKIYFLTGNDNRNGGRFIEKKITEGLYGQMLTNSFHLIIS